MVYPFVSLVGSRKLERPGKFLPRFLHQCSAKGHTLGRNDETLVFNVRGAYVSTEVVLMLRKKTSVHDSLTWVIDKIAKLSWAKVVLYLRL